MYYGLLWVAVLSWNTCTGGCIPQFPLMRPLWAFVSMLWVWLPFSLRNHLLMVQKTSSDGINTLNKCLSTCFRLRSLYMDERWISRLDCNPLFVPYIASPYIRATSFWCQSPKLLIYNQIVAESSSLGWKVPYLNISIKCHTRIPSYHSITNTACNLSAWISWTNLLEQDVGITLWQITWLHYHSLRVARPLPSFSHIWQ
jgi:hypothetical protein